MIRINKAPRLQNLGEGVSHEVKHTGKGGGVSQGPKPSTSSTAKRLLLFWTAACPGQIRNKTAHSVKHNKRKSSFLTPLL